MENSLALPNPIVLLLMGIIIIFAVIKGKHHKNLAKTSLASLFAYLFVTSFFSEQEILNAEILLTVLSISFATFFATAFAWILFDIKHSRNKRPTNT